MTYLSEKLIELVAYDHVLIAGTRVARPIGVGIPAWEAFWRGVQDADDETALSKEYDRGYDEGRADGLEEGFDQGKEEGFDEGYSIGLAEGVRSAHADEEK